MAYHNNQMGSSRRNALLSLLVSPLAAVAQEQEEQRRLTLPDDPKGDKDQKLPNGKSRNDAIAKKQHEDAMRDVEDLVSAAQELKQELEHAGNYIVPVSSVRKTEEIEKLARRIRGRLKN